MHQIHRENVKNIFEHLNERTQTAFSEHDFTIYNEKNLYNKK